MPGPVPRGEEAHLTEIAIIGEIQFWAKTQDLPIQNDGPRIVSTVPVKQRQANIDDDSVK
jgi:hypothetical protein